MGIGSSGVEGLAAAHLTSSLDNSMSNAPMPLSDPSVKPMLLSFPHLAEYARPNALMLVLDPSVKLVLLSFPHLAQYARPITLMQWRRFFRQPSDVPMVGHRIN